jgi:hypothetical protein
MSVRSAWNRLQEGAKVMIGSASYVCMGWVPVSTNAGDVVPVAHLWGKCRKCGEGFSSYHSKANIDAGYAARTCVTHRGQRHV